MAEKKLTDAGLAWLTLAVDPWHDTTVTGLRGLPDNGVSKSVTFQVVQEYPISKNNSPVALPAGNWSCRIGNFPKLVNETLASGQYWGDVITQNNAPGTGEVLIPVQVNYAQDGADFADCAVIALANAQGCQMPVEFTKGSVRVIAMGIEVINTTASLQKQGLVSYARMPQPEVEPYTAYVSMSTPPNAWAVKTVTPIRSLPKNKAELALYPGYAQVEALEGYYGPVLLKFNKKNSFPTTYCSLLLDDDPSGGLVDRTAPGINCRSSYLQPFTPPGTTTQFYTAGENPIFTDCDSNVVMFTGLSDQTTLDLRVRWICERFPSDQEKELLVVSTPSAPPDPLAFEIYGILAAWMPAGFMFRENPLGEMFAKIMAKIGEIVGPIVSTIPHPVARIAGPAITAGAAALGDYSNSKAQKRKGKNQAQAYGAGLKKNKLGQIVPIKGPPAQKKR